MRRRLLSSLLSVTLLLASGCTSYRYEITAGSGQTSEVLKDRDLVIPAAPAQLRLRQVESRCVVLITNPTTQPITIDGGNSTIVDPKGQSRSVASQLIAGQSFVKLILPPMRDYDPQGPTVHLGLGFVANAATVRTPQYLDVNPASQEYWEWDGAGAIHLILTLRQNDQSTRHEWTISRSER